MEVSHFKFQLLFSKSTIFGSNATVCKWNAAVLSFTLLMVIYVSLQCSIKMEGEFLHHIYLLKVDGGLSFQSFNSYFPKSTIFGSSPVVLEWNAAVLTFT